MNSLAIIYMLVLQSQLAPAGLEDGRPSADLLHTLRDSVSSRAPQAPGVMQLLDQVFATLLTSDHQYVSRLFGLSSMTSICHAPGRAISVKWTLFAVSTLC